MKFSLTSPGTKITRQVNLSRIKPHRRLRDQLDIDSMDLLNFLIAVHKRFNIDIPEADYPQLATLDGFVDYIAKAQTRK